MNSYPIELLVQLAPVMFVAGLEAAPSKIQSPALPQSPTRSPTLSSSPPTLPAKPSTPQDAFAVLAFRLREAFLSQRKPTIWAPDPGPESSKTFQIIPVDKNIRFPPRKMNPQEGESASAMHSPLSPLTPSSPLFPDGLIAPIWIRKHTTLVPSVFVLFMRLFELPPIIARSPLDPPDPERERERDIEERRKDTDLSAEIAQRKKATSERGIKLTVVLMASRRMLDDPSLDARLTFVRRQSGLDSRAALFVLSPVSVAELNEFVRSLQDALYEPAVEYYTNHSKRVRRKRNRHSQAPSYNINPSAVRLRPEGWTVRYEYKMACFAEFRGEDEVALKHYQDAYSTLVLMFGSTAILPPRTKRWAEAKVLADTINVKICKLYLYNNEHSLALSQHSSHMRKFADFSRGWGIGEETFEFWSWMARQHRILAELLEQGTHSTLSIPSYLPPPTAAPNTQPPIAAQGAADLDMARSLGLNPSHALQHPGFYYYMAAKCTEKRRERFLASVEAETAHGTMLGPGFVNEKKVDHLTIILELYTKSYELFKKYSPINSQNVTQGRLTLWIAYRIAQTYYDSDKFEMSVRFFERIAKTYRREKWGSMLRPLLSTWYSCAQQLGAIDLSVKLLVEMLGHGKMKEGDEPGAAVDNLLLTLKDHLPSSPEEPLLVDLSESEPIFNAEVVFWSSDIKVGEAAAFQLSLTSPSDVDISLLPISSLAIHFDFETEEEPLTIRHITGDFVKYGVRQVALGHTIVNEEEREDIEANLRWGLGETVVFSGTLSSTVPSTLKVSKIVVTLEENSWVVDIPFDPVIGREGSYPHATWLRAINPVRYYPILRDSYSTAIVRYRPHQLLISLSHQAPAFLDEDYPIVLDITNSDDREMEITVDVLLQPTEIDHAINYLLFDEERSTGLLKGISFGVIAPGANVLKSLYLVNTGAPGDRVLDISVQSRAVTKPVASFLVNLQETPVGSDTTEALHTLTVPALSPFSTSYDVRYRRSLSAGPGLSSLETYNSDFWDDREGGEAIVSARIEAVGPWTLEVQSVALIREDGEQARVIDCSLDHEDGTEFPAESLSGDEMSGLCRITLAPEEDQDYSSRSIPGPGAYEIVWRRKSPDNSSQNLPFSTSRFPLPPLEPPSDGLVALLEVPPTAKLHVAMSISLSIRNLHHSRSANITVQLEPDPGDAFVVAGLRSGRVPVLLPGGEERLTWRLIPVECGHMKMPQLKVTDRRAKMHGEGDAEGESVSIIDVRWDQRKPNDDLERGTDVRRSMESTRKQEDSISIWPSVLVLP